MSTSQIKFIYQFLVFAHRPRCGGHNNFTDYEEEEKCGGI
jgi:hypothetical protein